MRIALLSHQWPGARMGGIGTAVRHLAGALAEAGNDVHVFTLELPADARENVPAGVKLHEAMDLAGKVRTGGVPGDLAGVVHKGGDGVYRLALGWLLCQTLLKVHRDQPFDVIEAPEVEAMSLPLLLRANFDVPVVTHLHCCTALARKINGAPGGDDRGVLEALEFAAIHLADAVCAPTRAVVEATRTICPVRQDVRIVPHAFDAEKRAFTPPGRDGPILFVGRLERLKGVKTLADALNLFLPSHPGAVFRFVGPDTATGPDKKSMRQWIESKLLPPVRSQVEFAGELPAEQIARQWARARFGVMPSLWENFSMACCEAMAAGRTVIVAQGTGSVEVLGESGVACQPESAEGLCAAMDRLWTDQPELDRLSRAAFERITTVFSPDPVAGAREGFYREVAAEFARCGSGAKRQAKLMTFPPECAAAVLPALVRMTGALAGIDTGFQTPGARLLNVMERVKAARGTAAEVLLYGAGKHTARLMSERHLWESRQHRVVGIIDDHPRFERSPVHLGLPVQSLGLAKARVMAGDALPPVVLSTDTYEDQFWKQSEPLREAGVAVYRLYS